EREAANVADGKRGGPHPNGVEPYRRSNFWAARRRKNSRRSTIHASQSNQEAGAEDPRRRPSVEKESEEALKNRKMWERKIRNPRPRFRFSTLSITNFSSSIRIRIRLSFIFLSHIFLFLCSVSGGQNDDT